MTTTKLDLKVTADSRAAVAGLKPLNTALEKAKDEAQDTEHALKDLSGGHKIKIDDDAVDRARREITRLRAQIRDDLRLDINADTRTAERRIRELSRSIKAIDNQEKVEVKVDVDKTGIGMLGKLKSGVGGIGKLGGPLGALGSAVGSLTMGLGALAIAGGAAVGWTLGLADGLANAKIAFTQFLGSGDKATKFLDNLQAFSAKTPFEFPELVDSSKKLLAFGVNSKEVIGILTSLGDAAALTGADVGDLTTIWGQMAAKGKVSNEELLQLTEAGVPAYGLLADKMHLSVAEIQDMASKGKLLSDQVLPVLQGQMDKTFGGGMQKQAKTLGGMFSTLKDTLGQFGTQLGQAFTPVVGEQITKLTGKFEEMGRWASENKETLVLMFAGIAGASLDFAADVTTAFQGIINAVAELFDAFSSMENIIKVVSPAAAIMFRNVDFDKAADDLRKVAGRPGTVSDGLRGAADDARQTGTVWAKTFRESDNVQRVKNDIQDVRAELRELRKQPPSVKVDADIKAAEAKLRRYRRELRGLNEEKTETRVDVKIGKAQKNLKDWRASLRWLRTLKPTAEVRLKIENAKKQIKRFRADLKELIKRRIAPIDVKIEGAAAKIKRIRDTLKDLGKKKQTPEVRAKTEKAQGNLDRLTAKLRGLRQGKAALLKVIADTDPAKRALGKLTKKQIAEIRVTAPLVKPVKGKIDEAARKRNATIDVGTKGVEDSRKRIDGASKKRAATINVGTEGVQAANKRINDAARDRTSTIWVTTRGAGRRGNQGPTNDAPGTLSLVPQLFGANPATIAGLRAVARAAPQMVATQGPTQTVAAAARKERREQLRPRQTPVQVFLDGAVIADQVSLRNERMAVASTTRRIRSA